MPADTHFHTKTQYASISSPLAVMYLRLYTTTEKFLPGLMLFYAFQKNNEVIKPMKKTQMEVWELYSDQIMLKQAKLYYISLHEVHPVMIFKQ